MNIDPMLAWTGVISLILTMLGYAFNVLVKKVQELQEKLQDVRENFIRRNEMYKEIGKVAKTLERLEDKIDKLGLK
tara:strand:+ start:126 stop:353 length:228 start_codon:yes stop_codon:yes gene_type:complete